MLQEASWNSGENNPSGARPNSVKPPTSSTSANRKLGTARPKNPITVNRLSCQVYWWVAE